MTREDEWADPEIQKLLMDLKATIDAYRHVEKKNSGPAASVFAADECQVDRETTAEVFTDPLPEAARPNRLSKIKQQEEPAA